MLEGGCGARQLGACGRRSEREKGEYKAAWLRVRRATGQRRMRGARATLRVRQPAPHTESASRGIPDRHMWPVIARRALVNSCLGLGRMLCGLGVDLVARSSAHKLIASTASGAAGRTGVGHRRHIVTARRARPRASRRHRGPVHRSYASSEPSGRTGAAARGPSQRTRDDGDPAGVDSMQRFRFKNYTDRPSSPLN